MSVVPHFAALLRGAPVSDKALLLITFGLLVDLVVARSGQLDEVAIFTARG